MAIEILHRYTRAVLYRSESAADLKAAVVEAVAKRANLRGADLVDAYLVGADLRGADLRGADLRDAYLVGADLVDADLRGADLRGADLRDAYLVGAEIFAGEITSVVGTGHLLHYAWTAYAMKGGEMRLRYGCEEHTIAEWREQNEALAEKHAGAEKARYVSALSALFALVEAAAKKGAPDV